MPPTIDALVDAFASAARQELGKASQRLHHCLGQLTDQQVWQRPTPTMNSIGNLVLHLCGNLRQWIVAGVGGEPDLRRRPEEFAEQGPIPRAELLQRLDSVVARAQEVLSEVSATQLMRPRRIQGFEVTGFDAILDSLPHFRGHTQEIIHMTRVILRDTYEFAWVPTTPEEGA